MKKVELCCNLTPVGECQVLLDLNIGWINFTAIIYVNNEWFHEKKSIQSFGLQPPCSFSSRELKRPADWDVTSDRDAALLLFCLNSLASREKERASKARPKLPNKQRTSENVRGPSIDKAFMAYAESSERDQLVWQLKLTTWLHSKKNPINWFGV